MAAECQYTRRYGPVLVDLSYLDNTSDERLRTIVRAWYGTDDVDEILAPGPFVAA